MATSETKELDSQTLAASDLTAPDAPSEEVPVLATNKTAKATKKAAKAKPETTAVASGECPKGGEHEWTEDNGERFCLKCKEPAEHATTGKKAASKKLAKANSSKPSKPSKKPSKKVAKKSAKKSKPKSKIDLSKLSKSSRVIYQIPLNLIVSNPGNVGHYREQEVIRNLYRQGYRIFKTPGVDANHTLWTMLNGEPNAPPTPALRATALQLIREFEAQLLEPGENIHQTKLIHPIQVKAEAKGFGIISGLVRAFSVAIDHAVREQPPGEIEGEVNTTDDTATHLMAISENLVRIAANPMVMASGFHLMRKSGLSLAEISRKFGGRSEQTISNYLDLMLLPDDVQQQIVDRVVVMTSAREAVQSCREKLRLEGKPITEEALRELLAEKYAPKSSPTTSSKIEDDEDFDDDENDEDEDEDEGGGSGSGRSSGSGSLPRHSDGTLMKNKVRKFDDLFIMYMSIPKPEDPAVLNQLPPVQLAEKVIAAQRRQRELLREVMQISEDAADEEENRRRIEKMSNFTL